MLGLPSPAWRFDEGNLLGQSPIDPGRDRSQKAAKGVHIQDLARYIDERAEAARRERDAFNA